MYEKFNELSEMVFGCENLLKLFNKNDYATAFNDYFKKYRKVFDSLEEEYNSSEDKEGFINGVADKFIDFAKEQCNANIKKYDREAYVADHNSLLTVYFLPALIETRYDSCEKLAKVVLEKWNSSITKYKLQIGTFSDIDASFKRKLCYITTAVCESLGKGDDCYELNILRDYRDGYLSSTEEGRQLIEEYYNIAPTIVNRINKTDNSGEVYSSIFTNYLSPCINYIEQGNNRECQDCYTEMVRVLQNKYMGF